MYQCIHILGHVGKDPEVSETKGGTPVAKLNVATSQYRKGQDGERVQVTEWHRVVTFGQPAQFVGKYVVKGSLVLVTGKVHTRKYVDRDGVEKYITEVVADEVKLLSSAAPERKREAKEEVQQELGVDEDIPF